MLAAAAQNPGTYSCKQVQATTLFYVSYTKISHKKCHRKALLRIMMWSQKKATPLPSRQSKQQHAAPMRNREKNSREE
jgi:hypothetical protein